MNFTDAFPTVQHTPSTASRKGTTFQRFPDVVIGWSYSIIHCDAKVEYVLLSVYTKSEIIPFTTESNCFILLIQEAITRVKTIRSVITSATPFHATQNPRESAYDVLR